MFDSCVRLIGKSFDFMGVIKLDVSVIVFWDYCRNDTSVMAKKLYIGSLAWATTDADLREAFGQYGEIEDAVVISDRESGRSRGFGFVTFTDDAAADAAVAAMHGQMLQGREIVVNEAQEREARD